LIRAEIAATLPAKVGSAAAKPPPYNPVKSRRNPIGSASISTADQ